MTVRTLALAGATGGAGTTRTAVELATALADDGRDAAVLDAAYATQGLSEYVSGPVETDVTALVTDDEDAPLSAAASALHPGVTGEVDLLPARAPFERVARAKTAAAARGFADRLAAAADAYDHVVVDVPPVASNQAVAAVDAAERVAVVAPATPHGADATSRLRGRLRDVDAPADSTVATRGRREGADVSLPETDPSVTAAPTCLADDEFRTATVAAAEALFDVDLDVETDSGGLLPDDGLLSNLDVPGR